MSRDAVFAFTEGYTDRFPYSQVIDEVCIKRGVSSTIVNAEEIPDSGGGKPALLAFFDYAKRHDLLANQFKGKFTISVFLLDKDLDDVTRRRRRSPHTIYTPTYELENLLFLHGDLNNAAAAAACLGTATFKDEFLDRDAWCAKAALCWQKWVTLCAFSALKASNARAFYRRPHSQINRSAYAAPTEATFRNEVVSFEKDWAGDRVSFDAAFDSIVKLVDRAYREGHADHFFKGTWYCHFVYEDVCRLAGDKRWNRNGFQERLLSCLAMAIQRDCTWTRELCARLDEIIAAILGGPRLIGSN